MDKGKISGLQLMFLVAGFVQGSVLLISFTTSLTKHDTWLVVLSGFVLIVPVVLSYALLAKRFAGISLVRINDIVFGRYLGKAVSIYYILFFMLTLSFNFRDLGDFYTTFLMTDTPLIFFLIVFISVCAYAVRVGIENLGRVSHLFVFTAFFIVISTFILMLDKMDFSNILPVFELSPKIFLQGTHIIASVPFGELVTFLTIMAALNDTRHIVRNTLTGLLLGAASLLLVSLRNTFVLGSMESVLTSPSFQAARLIDLGTVLTRMDLLVGIGQTMMQFLKCCLFYYAIAVSISQLLRLRSYLPMILPIGGIEAVLAVIVFQSSVEHNLITISAGIIYSIPVIYILPPLTLLIAGLRKLPRPNEVKQ